MPFSKKSTNLRVPYARSVYDSKEEKAVLRVMRAPGRMAMGPETRKFEERVAKACGKKYGIMVNSGSSANLLSVELLDLPRGSEVITPILTFSTTVAPLVQKGLIPAFTDVEEGTYNINISQMERLLTKKTKALMIPLFLGNVPNLSAIKIFAKKHRLFFIEDSCDTLGATYRGVPSGRFSDITTTSFYGAHIITATSNGGMLMVNNPEWRDFARVLRGWGRSSALFGESEDIRQRFKARLGKIPYDAKFVFDKVGYNLLPSEMGAAFGNVQMDRLPVFRKRREHNFKELSKFFKSYEEFFIRPIQNPEARTQWISFPLTIRKGAPFTRMDIMSYLEKNNIQTRPVATGNILLQPGFRNIVRKTLREGYPVADEITKRGFVIGVHHGLMREHLDKMKRVLREFLKKYSSYS
ncbi:MAG: DegT/DnrJ/EryC1/StrS family aminotransferase [Patescibacteria group bacterium]|nr:DegT/DnrJ/EryC1/StrS family aminotransferase [Patescibacteria group bacterium]MDE2015258.1 DegT/DnrJ/EryC1/StrS family aminotransferase [Patescibacteria group bacterium]MDE2227064.1 DegT/DnrJ/EryC1/StrS family aminotransferase [Patescibacteria group bacterium]